MRRYLNITNLTQSFYKIPNLIDSRKDLSKMISIGYTFSCRAVYLVIFACTILVLCAMTPVLSESEIVLATVDPPLSMNGTEMEGNNEPEGSNNLFN